MQVERASLEFSLVGKWTYQKGDPTIGSYTCLISGFEIEGIYWIEMAVVEGKVKVEDEVKVDKVKVDESGAGEMQKAEVLYGFSRKKGTKRKKTSSQQIEDFHVAKVAEVDGQEIGLFAVMDGHSGPHVAKYLTHSLFELITRHPRFSSEPQNAIVDAFHEIDKRILEMADSNPKWKAGSTATTALLLDSGTRLIVANIGDSRAVLSRGKAVDLSVDHEPQKPEEKEMVESKGGTVSRSVAGIYRVDRRLAMSRAFGDVEIKEHLSVHPDIWDEDLLEDDEFFVIASDGLWNVMSSQEVVDYIQATPGNAEEVAQALVTAAVKRRSTDDISCLVVFL
ncbi:hypothetical protein R1sor_007754 [Riccia sorocarpa]|uniref:PPM-type phosphatase domain-containing protein n=1 Tax=Riccia sorocarpa TaxID=122646 RepID=A0ABD3HRQ8_9MARC